MSTEKRTNGSVKFLDLSVPQFGLPVYDIVVSLEVAEHIPAEFEANFLDNLARYAKEGLLLSWAAVGQGGYAHVNNRPLEHVTTQLQRRGFRLNSELSKQFKQAAHYDFLKRNLHFYDRITSIDEM